MSLGHFFLAINVEAICDLEAQRAAVVRDLFVFSGLVTKLASHSS